MSPHFCSTDCTYSTVSPHFPPAVTFKSLPSPAVTQAFRTTYSFPQFLLRFNPEGDEYLKISGLGSLLRVFKKECLNINL